MSKQGQIIGEDKYSEKWSFDGETYVWVPKWVTQQVWNEAIKECEGCVKKKHSTTKEELQEHLRRIGWDFSGRYPNEWIKDHNGKRTNYRVCGDCIQVKGVHESSDTCFHFKGAETVMVDEDAVALGTQECFILFMNHDLKKKPLPKPNITSDK